MSFPLRDLRLKVFVALFLILGVFAQSLEGIKCYKCEAKIKDCNKLGTVSCPAGSYCYKQSWDSLYEDEGKKGCMSRELGECLGKVGGCEVANSREEYKELQGKVNACAGTSFSPSDGFVGFPFRMCWCNTDRCNPAGQSTSNYKLIFGVLTIVASYNYFRGMTWF